MMNSILMHVCCGPCAVYPLTQLRVAGYQVSGYFYNPNIHPYREFKRRLNGMRMLAEQEGMTVELDREYGLEPFLRQVVFNERTRCQFCYRMRLEAVAKKACLENKDAFTSSLLYSKYQNHTLIRQIGQEMAEKYGVTFFYEDFRTGWQIGIDEAIGRDLYRQAYCGCIYSEQERYDKKFRKRQQQAIAAERPALGNEQSEKGGGIATIGC